MCLNCVIGYEHEGREVRIHNNLLPSVMSVGQGSKLPFSWYLPIFLGILFDLLPLASCYFSYLQKKRKKRNKRKKFRQA